MGNSKKIIENYKNKADIKDKKCELKELNKAFCFYCSSQVELVWVHSHYQCPNCKNVVISCCGDN